MPTRIEVDESINELISKTSSTDRITDTEHREANKQMLDYVDQEVAAVGGGGGGSSTFAGLSDAATANIPAINTPTATALGLKAPLASPTFTGTVSGITKAMVGLGNVDNTSDANKPVSTAQATAIALKANISSPTFTGVPAAPTAAFGTNTTQLATTAFVKAAVDAGGGGGGGDLPVKNLVTDFGVIGDGVTDNSAALDALMAQDCRDFVVFAPEGVYLGENVTLNLHLNMFGAGLNTGVDEGSGVEQHYAAVFKSISGGPIFKTAHDIPTTWFPGKLESLQFDGNNVGTNALDIGGVQAYTIERCGFRNFAGPAIKSYGSLGCDIYGCTFFDNQYDIDLNTDGTMPPNFINIRNNRFFGAKKYSIRGAGSLSMLIVKENNFEFCGTVADSASGLLSITTAYEGIGLIFSDNYIEQTKGFASINIGPASSDVVRYVIENNQMNAPSGAGPATHDIYIDANGANKQRVYLANNLIRNAGGLTVSGTNATLTIINSTIPTRNIPSGVKVVEIDDSGVITGILTGASTPTDTPFDENVLFDGDRITNHTVTGPISFDPNPVGRVKGGKHKYVLIADGVNTPTCDASLIATSANVAYATPVDSVNIITFEWNGSNYTRTNVTAGTVSGGGGGTFPFFTDFESDTTGGTPAGLDVEANMTVTANSYIGGTKELEIIGGNLFNFGIINGANAPLAAVNEIDVLLHAGHAATEIVGPVQRANSLVAGSVSSFYTAALRPATSPHTVELLYFSSLGVAATVLDTVTLSGAGNVLTLTDVYHVYYEIDASHNHIVRVSRSSDGKFLTDVAGVGTWVTGSADLYNLNDTSITTAGGAGIVTVYSSGGPQVYIDNVDVS